MNSKEKRVAKAFKYETKKMNYRNSDLKDMPRQVSFFDYQTHRSHRKINKKLTGNGTQRIGYK